jgi:hypothetical protein
MADQEADVECQVMTVEVGFALPKARDNFLSVRDILHLPPASN